MKKLFLILFATMLAGQAWAYDFMSDGICYSNVTDGVAVVAMNENSPYLNYPSLEGTVVIPDNVSGKPVIEIAAQAFHHAKFTEIIIGRNVTKVRTGAFTNCNNLERVISEKSKPAVWDEYNCRAATYWNAKKINNVVYQINDRDLQTAQIVLYVGTDTELTDFETTITIDDVECTVTAIGDNVFSGRNSLVSIEIPNTIISIGNSAFKNCSSLTTINIPDNVTSIGTSTFEGCSGMTSIEIPNSVVSIGNSAFKNCSSLTTINIPNNVTSIGTSTFEGCSGLTSIEIPNSVTTIENNTFWNCSGLTSISMSANIISIGGGAFGGCSSLTSIEIPNSVTTIGGSAFQNCDGLTEIDIPANVTTIGSIAFSGCNNLTTINVAEGNTAYCSEDGILFDNNKTTIICFPAGKQETSYTIPNDVINISDAFLNCRNLTSINIPNSVEIISKGAFSGCSSLESITLPFVGDKQHLSTDTYQYPFGYIFGEIDFIGDTSITQSYYGSSTSTFTNITYHIPSSLKTVTITSGSFIPIGAFSNCSSLTSITIPDTVTSIGSNAFMNCSGLSKIEIPNSVESIGASAFQGCNGLTNIFIPKSVRIIGKEAFKIGKKTVIYCGATQETSGWKSNWTNCTVYMGITPIITDDYVYKVISETVPFRVEMWKYTGNADTIVIPTTISSKGVEYAVTSIGEKLYSGHSNLKSVIIGDSVEKIGSRAFAYCGISSITIPNSVASRIGSYAFENCTNLRSVIIGNGVKNIYGSEFENCSNLTILKIPNSIKGMGDFDPNKYEFLQYNEYNNALYLGNDETPYVALMKAKSKDITECDINKQCRVIAENAFLNCSKLASVTIPNSVICIDDQAFKGCVSLTSVVIPNSISRITYKAFGDCTGLTSITIPNSESLYIYGNAFENCYNVRSVSCLSTNPPTLNGDFSILDVIYVPAQSVDVYKNDSKWGQKKIMPLYYVSAKSENISFGTIQGDSLLLGDNPLTITAVPNEGYHFVGWSDGNKVNPRVFTEAKDTAVTALFEAHTVVTDVAVAATCTEKGKTEGKHCSVCNAVIVTQTAIPALGHEFTNYVYNNDATTEADGTETATCEHGCGEIDTRIAEGTRLSGTAVSESSADNLLVYAHGNAIIVENATAEIRVYDAMGRMIARRDAARHVSTAEIRVNTAGVYIVKVGNVVKRVMVND